MPVSYLLRMNRNSLFYRISIIWLAVLAVAFTYMLVTV